MTTKILINQDYGGNQALNAVMHLLGTAPSAPRVGQYYYNSGSLIGFIWNGTAWRPLDAAGLTDGSVPIAALATNPLARSNHTGQQPVSTLSDYDTATRAYRLNQFAVPNTNVAMAGYTFTGLASPTAAGQAAEYQWVLNQIQSAAAGIDSKPSVRTVATSNITLSNVQNIDGVTGASGDRVLVVGQTTGSQNGVYTMQTGAWVRVLDADQTGEITPGAFWFVEEGTTYGASQWRCSNTGSITLGSTSISIVQFGQMINYTAGFGLQLTGYAFALQPKAGGGLVADATGAYVDVSVVARKKTGAIVGDGTKVNFNVAHNLGIGQLVCQVYDQSTSQMVVVDVTIVDANNLTLGFAQAPSSSQNYGWVVVG